MGLNPTADSLEGGALNPEFFGANFDIDPVQLPSLAGMGVAALAGMIGYKRFRKAIV